MTNRSSLAMALVAWLLVSCQGEGATTSTTTGPRTDALVGVPECDSYLHKYESCITTRVPANSRPELLQAASKMREAWRASAANPAARGGLARGCERALEAARDVMSSYSCSF